MIAIGAMRLSTAADRDDGRAGEVLDAAITAGVTLIDTADAYAHDERDVGHNERLIAAARARHPGAGLTVATKGGLIRDGARWIADGRGVHLAAAARASRERLGGAPLDLYLLHAPDPQVPLATSVRALARLVDEGIARRIGLSNVGRVQLEEALAITPIAAVEVELGPHDVSRIRGGLLAACAERGITVLAHRPLGGPDKARRWARDRELVAVAARLGATAAELILAWLRGLSPVIVPLPGPSTVATAQSAARAAALVLDDEARGVLDRRFLPGRTASSGAERPLTSQADPAHHQGPRTPDHHFRTLACGSLDTRLTAPAPLLPRPDGREVVLLMGMPGAGKSTLAGELIARGYLRLNRDERGGKLDALAGVLDAALAEGAVSAVLDNTYPTRASRAPVIDVAARHGLPVRCVWLDTAIEEAQVNAAARLLARYDRLPEPAELNKLAKRDGGAFRPNAQFGWRRELEPPAADEGFAAVERVGFTRAAPAAAGRPALIVDLDDVIRAGRPAHAGDVALVPGAATALAAWIAAGWAVAATAWQPAPTTADHLAAVDARTCELLGFAVDIVTCTHPAGPPACWCRKPMPGLGLLLARRHGLDLARSIHVGRGAADRGFATRLGMRFTDPEALAAAPAAVS